MLPKSDSQIKPKRILSIMSHLEEKIEQRKIKLLIETYVSWSSHLETSGEIALTLRDKGNPVGFCYIHTKNPDHNPNQLKTFYERLYLPNVRRKVRKFNHLIEKEGVDIIKQPKLDNNLICDIEEQSEKVFENLDHLKRYTFKGAELGLGVASSLISYLKTPNPDVKNYQELVQTYLKSALIVFESTLNLINEIQPEEIITFNGRFALSKPIAEAAKMSGIPVRFHERGSNYKRYMLIDGAIHDYRYRRKLIKDYWNESNDKNKNKLGAEYFIRRREGDGIEWHSFVEYQKKGKSIPKSSKLRYTYYTSSDDEIEAVGDTVEHPLFKNQRTAIAWLIDYFKEKSNCELVIRVHPHLKEKHEEERDWWDNLKGPNVITVSSDDDTDTYSLLDSSEVVLTYSSTVGAEATFHGKPSIILGDTFYRNFDCVYEPKDELELKELLDQASKLKPKKKEKCLPFGYYMINHGAKFKYYEPSSLTSGKFLGKELSDSSLINIVRNKVGI